MKINWSNFYVNEARGEWVYLGKKNYYLLDEKKFFKRVEKINFYQANGDLTPKVWPVKWFGLFYKSIRPSAINFFEKFAIEFVFYDYPMDNVLEVCSNYKVLSWTIDYYVDKVEIALRDEKNYILFIEWFGRFFSHLEEYSIKSVQINNITLENGLDLIEVFEVLDKIDNKITMLFEKSIIDAIGLVLFVQINDSSFDDTTVLNYKSK